jgi:UbiD family decarboxylase
MREYVDRLLQRGEMRVVEREVDPHHELAAVIKLSQAESELPILFRRVKGSHLSVVTNLYGSRQRLCEMIGAEDGNFARRWMALKAGMKPSATEFLKTVGAPNDLRDGTLSQLPQITYWERDAAPYFTAAIFLAKEPDTGVANLSFHRSMMVSDEELRIRLGTTRPHALSEESGGARRGPAGGAPHRHRARRVSRRRGFAPLRDRRALGRGPDPRPADRDAPLQDHRPHGPRGHRDRRRGRDNSECPAA